MTIELAHVPTYIKEAAGAPPSRRLAVRHEDRADRNQRHA